MAAFCMTGILALAQAQWFDSEKRRLNDAVPLESVTALTFIRGKMTAARRHSPVKQLECRGAPCSEWQADVMQVSPEGASRVGK